MPAKHADELLRLAGQADADKPFIAEQLAKLNAAAAAPGPAGDLRRSVHSGRRDLWTLSRESGLAMQAIDNFLQGGDLSTTDFIKLAEACGLKVSLTAAS
jgi:hypothetical protein